MKIDSRFKIIAANIQEGHICDETNSLLLCAKGLLVPVVMQSYLNECIRIGTSQEHIDGTKCLIKRIEGYAAGTYTGAIDRKYRLLAINPQSREFYDENNSFILLATDQAVPAALKTYLGELEKINADEEYILMAKRLLAQVMEFQVAFGCSLPVTAGGEATRCMETVA